MPIPALTPQGLLPPGTHECLLDEIEAVFADLPPQPRRRALWNGFRHYVNEVKKHNLVIAIYVDGGFTTDRSTAKDIDAVLEIPFPDLAIKPRLNQPEFDHDHVLSTYQVDMYIWWDGNPAPARDVRAYFQYLKPKDAIRRGLSQSDRKGILKINL